MLFHLRLQDIAIGHFEPIRDVAAQLVTTRQASITLASYRYNGDGQRVSRIEGSGTTHTVYDEAGHWLGDYDADGRALMQAIWLNDYPVGLIVDGRVLYVEADHLGTPRAVIDPTRNVAVWHWALEGEAFGADYPDEDPDGDGHRFTLHLRFPGQRYDAVSGLHYNYHRYLDPVSGRYIQSDPIGLAGGISTYAYVGSNPYTRIDPMGLSPQDDSQRLGLLESALLADMIFLKNYRSMREANTIGADKYFHCKANCEAAKLGTSGVIEAAIVSEAREYADQYIKGDSRSACDEDRAANGLGRIGGRANPSSTCSATCSSLRPNGLDQRY